MERFNRFYAGVAVTYSALGLLALLQGDLPQADHRYSQSLAIKERLGHSSVQITLDVYSHATKGMQDDAAALIGTLVLGDGESHRQRAYISADGADFATSKTP